MTAYLLKMMTCSAAFYALYALVFQREKMLVFNRFYLLGSLVFAFVIPLITIEVIAPAVNLEYSAAQLPNTIIYSTVEQTSNPDFYINILYTIAIIVSIVLLIRLIRNIIQIKRSMARHKTVCIKGAKISLIDKAVVPHSFLNTVFLNKAEYEAGRIEAEVLAHELAHIKQKHSWDILFIELLQIFCWSNPIFYLYKRSIKINHEMLADAAVIKHTDDVRSYQQVLLQRAIAQSSYALVSSLNFYTTKKRFIMLQKTYQKRKATLLGFLVVPLLLGLTLTFCNRVEKQVPSESTQALTDNEIHDSSATVASVQHQDSVGISEAEMNEFKTLLEASSELVDGKRAFKMSKKTTGDKAIALYNQMTNAQKESVKYLGVIQSPPPPPKMEVNKFAPPKKEIKRFTPPKVVYDLPEGKGASTSELAEYEAIIKEIKVGENRYKEVAGKSEKLFPIYKKMTLEQRSKASQLPPPPPPEAPVQPSAMAPMPPPPPKGVTQSEQTRYNAILSKLDQMSEAEKNKDSYKKWNEGVTQAADIYNKMSDAQQAKVKMPPPRITSVVIKEPEKFTPPKIVKTEPVKYSEVTISKIGSKPAKAVPVKKVKNEAVKINVVTIAEE